MPSRPDLFAIRPAPAVPGGEQVQTVPSNPLSKKTGKGQVYGNYEIVGTLGTGSFGKVRLGKHMPTGCLVAMKFISKKKISTKEQTERVDREIQYLTILDHPHIIKLYDVIWTPDSIIMIIEYLKGELFQYIVNRGRMPETEGRKFFQQIICAVEYCHALKIVHRDLKPENLLLDANNNVKIADFGLSNIMQDGDFLKTSCGSPNYAAPEVIAGKLYAGPEIDIWSCGVILFVMLAGRLPFDDDHIPLLFKKISQGQYIMPPFLGRRARDLIDRMIVVDSNKRIKLADIKASAWFQEGLPAYLREPPPSDRTDDHHSTPSSANSSTTDLHSQAIDIASQASLLQRAEAGHAEIMAGVGVVDDESIAELCKRMNLDTEETWSRLRSGEDKQLIVSYKLIRDQMPTKPKYDDRSPLSHSHGPSRHPSMRRSRRHMDDDEPSAPSKIKVLEASLPRKLQASDLGMGVKPSPLTAGRTGMSATSALAPLIIPTTSTVTKRGSSKIRWHFGIRSKSEPYEVMLEIYKTLKQLGFEWRPRGTDVQEEEDDEEGKKKRRNDAESRTKKAQLIFLIEARTVKDGIVIRMDLQLFQIDKGNYLVDFRNLGYRSLPQHFEESTTPSDFAAHRSYSHGSHSGIDTPGSNAPSIIRPTFRPAPVSKNEKLGVSSPFLFLEACTALIMALAG